MINDSAKNLIRLVIITCVAASLIAWADTWDQIRKGSANITSVQADFTQTKHLAILSKPLVSKGRLCFQAPGSLRWEYFSPVKSVLLMHGGAAVRYVIKNEKTIRDSSPRLQSMQIVLQDISMWMKGNFDANPAFTPELKPGRIIELVPKGKSLAGIIQRIELRLSATPGVIQSVAIYESNQSYTTIAFFRVILNQNIPESLFKGPR